MRFTFAAAALALVFGVSEALAFEAEDQAVFGDPARPRNLRVLSTSDIEIFGPLVDAFVARNLDISVTYTVATSQEVFQAIYHEGADFDLVISSAMDLQFKIANDNRAVAYRSSATATLPRQANWRDRIFAFTFEPATFLISRRAFSDTQIPQSRQQLVDLVRQDLDRFKGRIGTYDIRTSGLGYLLATQDARNSDVFWQLTEVFGLAGTELYCCSADMIEAVESGRLAFAYNVLESYALRRVAAEKSNVELVQFDDFQTAIMRTVLIPRGTHDVETAGRLIDFLIELNKDLELAQASGFRPIRDYVADSSKSIGLVTLGSSLLVYLDAQKRRAFVDAWRLSMRRTQSQ